MDGIYGEKMGKDGIKQGCWDGSSVFYIPMIGRLHEKKPQCPMF